MQEGQGALHEDEVGGMGIALAVLQADQGRLRHRAGEVRKDLPGLVVDLHLCSLHRTHAPQTRCIGSQAKPWGTRKSAKDNLAGLMLKL